MGEALAVVPKPPACRDCPAYDYGVGFVEPSSPDSPDFAVVGQGPGEQEANSGIPFYHQAPAGWRLTRWFSKAGIPRAKIWIGNVVQCWLPATKKPYPSGSREPKPAEILYCWQAHVGKALDRVPADVPIFSVGGPATKWLIGISGNRVLGTPNIVELPEVSNDNR